MVNEFGKCHLAKKFSAGSQVSSTKKLMKKADSVSYLQKKCSKLWTMPSQQQQKSHKLRDEIILLYVSKVSLKSCKISNITAKI